MQFINPYEILEVETQDSNEIKKAKRRKLAEFDLAQDGTIEFNNVKIHKAEFIEAVDELDNLQKSRFYWSLKKETPQLNNFLTKGDLSYFYNFQAQKIYEHPEFIAFVSPYFAQQYNRVLLVAFQKNDIELVKKITQSAPILVNNQHLDKAYEGVRKLLNDIIQNIQSITQSIDDEEGHYTAQNSNILIQELKKDINIQLVNILPDYFQGIRNEIAQKIRNLSVIIFNNLHNSKASLEIIEFALKIKVNTITRQRLQEDHQQISEIHKEREEAHKYGAILIKYAFVIQQLIKWIEGINFELELDIKSLRHRASKLINIQELNQLPPVFDEIRIQIAMGLKTLSVLVFNKYMDIKTSTDLINLALEIQIQDPAVRNHLKSAANDLRKIVANISARRRYWDCYIATACYQDNNAPQVIAFRNFRDQVLMNSFWGKLFVKFYYKYSPFWAKQLKNYPRVNKFIRNKILDFIYKKIKK
ncbi:MAG: CFI-box-CTERM domain-containing protein [Bacteroidia bacterium]|nr:hypothetical protein [Bacteroidia bacterium]MDW8158243.1 CFI-box-CTERM domain-containing protein [Bacteroidia bacterium]